MLKVSPSQGCGRVKVYVQQEEKENKRFHRRRAGGVTNFDTNSTVLAASGGFLVATSEQQQPSLTRGNALHGRLLLGACPQHSFPFCFSCLRFSL